MSSYAEERVDELRARADRLVYLADDEEDADEHDRLLAEAHLLRERASRLGRIMVKPCEERSSY